MKLILSIFVLVSLIACTADGDNAPEPSEPNVNEPDANAPDANEPDANEPDANEPAAQPDASPDASPDVSPPCNAGDLFGTCENSSEILVCNDGSEISYSCSDLCSAEGLTGGLCVSSGGVDDCSCSDDPEPTFSHGDACASGPTDACGFPASGLLCTVENVDDVQGVCRRICNSFSECLNDQDALNRFETECCDVQNGSQVCASDDVYPNACSGG